MSLESRLRLVETLAQNSTSIGDPEIAALNAYRRVQAYLRRRLREAIAGEPEAAEPARLLEGWEQGWWYRSGMLLPGGGLPEWDVGLFHADLAELMAYRETSGGLPIADSFDGWWPAQSAECEWERPPERPWASLSTWAIACHFRDAMLRDPLLAEASGVSPEGVFGTGLDASGSLRT